VPLHLITGSANAGMTEFIYSKLQACTAAGERALLLLPSGPDVSRATQELAAFAPIGIGIRGFDDELDQLWKMLGDGRQIATPVQRLVVLEESVRTSSPGLLGSRVMSPGVVRTLALTVQRAAESARPIVATHHTPGPGEELLGLAVVYFGLLRRAGLVERGEAHRLLSERLDAWEAPQLVAVDRFTSLTAGQEAFLAALASRTSVVVGISQIGGAVATTAANSLAARLGSVGKVGTLDSPRGPGVPAELARIEESFASSLRPELEAQGALRLSEAWGDAAEIARIVREVQDAIADGFRPEHIAVVFRDAGAHLNQLRRGLDEVGVLSEFDARVPFQATALGRVILLLIGLSGPGPTYGQLMDALRSPFSPANHDLVDRLDAHSRRARALDVAPALAWLRSRDPESARFIQDARRACRDVAGAGAERRWYELTSGMLRRAHLGAVTRSLGLMTDTAAARVVIEAVRGLSALGSAEARCSTLAAALRETRIALASEGRVGHVQVMSAERARGRRYDCVIIGGLNSGEFPLRVGEDALSAPAVVRAFKRVGIDTSPRTDLDAERLMFYLAATRATKRLVLSWQSHDAEGRPTRPSVFLDEVLDLYRDSASGEFTRGSPPRQVLGLDGLAEHPAAPRSRRRARRELVSRAADPSPRTARTRSGASAGVRAATEEREVFSASEIETYLQCPFRWFVQRLVQPRELDEQLDRAAAGRLAHEIMRGFYDDFIERTGQQRVTPESLSDARAIHAEVCVSALRDVRAATSAESALVRAVLRKTLRVIEADAELLPGMAPTHREWSFGMDEGDTAESFGDFSLAGRVDRIDTDRQALIVTDYKMGGVGSNRGAARFQDEGIVQLPLYVAVATRRLGLRAAGGLYREVSAAKPRGFVSDRLDPRAFVRTDVVGDDAIAGILDAAIEMASGAVTRMRAGDIEQSPRGGTCPSYCPARGFCAGWRPSRA